MNRRDFSAFLGSLAATSTAWPSLLRAQPKSALIGFMSGRSPADSSYMVEAFREGLAENGFAEGRNVEIEFRWADGDYSRLPALAAELLSKRVAVLVSVGGDASPLAAKQ